MTDSERSLVCPTCFFPLHESDTEQCPECGASLAPSSSFDHLSIIRAQGEMLRRGAHSPSGIVVVGMWLLFGPTFVIFVLLAISTGARSLVTSGPLLFLYGAILWKVTLRYRAARREAATEEINRRYDEPDDRWSDPS
ncbi:MAG TPA: hypothetical protein VFV19_07190 [Candidatus Polarisedimenticolaceae bacterium]|nr:hypothetical protein [Candidatus Polarisedimenticolaceae bacterium]